MLTIIKTFKQGLQQPYVDFVPTTSLDTKNWFFLLLPHKIHLCDQFPQCDQLLFTLFQEARSTCSVTIRKQMRSATNKCLMIMSLRGPFPPSNIHTFPAKHNQFQNIFKSRWLWKSNSSTEPSEEQLIKVPELP